MGYEMAEGVVWFLAAAGVLFCLSVLVFVVDWRRRQGEKAAFAAGVRAIEIAETERLSDLAETIEMAEWQLGLVMARLRAHAGKAYAVEGYRIRTEADFERSLDIAAALSVRIGDLAGAGCPGGTETELKRVREQIRRSLRECGAPYPTTGVIADRTALEPPLRPTLSVSVGRRGAAWLGHARQKASSG